MVGEGYRRKAVIWPCFVMSYLDRGCTPRVRYTARSGMLISGFVTDF